MIPFEALIPYGIMFGLFCAAGSTMSFAHAYKNNGKRERHIIDDWDKLMMERDLRLTKGVFRAQTDNPRAPPEFKTNSWWKAEKPAARF